MRGDWDAAEAAAELAGESVSATVASRLAAAGLLTAVGRGRLSAAARRAEELHDSHPADEQVVMLVGQAAAEAALWEGRPAGAARFVDEALAELNALFPFQLGCIMLAALGIAARADVVAAHGAGGAPHDGHDDDVAAAQRLAGVAEETAQRGVPRAGSLGPEGLAWLQRARAELTRVTGPPDPAAWNAVVSAFAYETGLPEAGGYRQAYGLLRRAEALLAAGAPHGPVADDLRLALGTARRLRAEPLAAAVRDLARRAGVQLEPAPAASAAADPFTRRERSVLALVAGGRTNRQVGAELFISEKTVSVHLSRVMAKLGAASRTEAVSVAYARGLLFPEGQELARSDP